MGAITGKWSGLAESSSVVRFVDISLRGVAQVMFQDNPLTGLLFLAGIAWGAIAAEMPQVAIGALVGVVVSTAVAMFMRVDETLLRSGLYGYNGVLVGAALTTFLAASPILWVYLIFGAALSVVVMLAIANVVKTWSVSALTFPFVLTTWVMLLAAYSVYGLHIAGLPHPVLPKIPGASHGALVSADSVTAVLNGVSQVFLIANAITGVIFLVALGISSLWAAGAALGGSLIALVVAVGLGADAHPVAAGLFGFSAVLTAIAIATVFYSPAPRVIAYTIAGTIFTVIVQAALNVALSPLGIPTLTAPFVLASWLFLLPRRSFAPVPHATSSGGALHTD